MTPAKRLLLKRLALATLLFAVTHTVVYHCWHWEIQGWWINLGEHWLGGDLPRISGRYMWGADGPFWGERSANRLCNILTVWGTWATPKLAGFAAAAGLSLLLHGPLARRVPRKPVPTRCGTCGYILAGLREPCCPECGTAI